MTIPSYFGKERICHELRSGINEALLVNRALDCFQEGTVRDILETLQRRVAVQQQHMQAANQA